MTKFSRQAKHHWDRPLPAQVYLMFEHAVSNYNTRFVMKADDDTFINVPALLHMLHKLVSESDRSFYIGMRLTRDWCVWPHGLIFKSCLLVLTPVYVIIDGQ